jgi:hypothetical protein
MMLPVAGLHIVELAEANFAIFRSDEREGSVNAAILVVARVCEAG